MSDWVNLRYSFLETKPSNFTKQADNSIYSHKLQRFVLRFSMNHYFRFMQRTPLFSAKRLVVAFGFLSIFAVSATAQSSKTLLKPCKGDTIFTTLPVGAKDSTVKWIANGLSKNYLYDALSVPSTRTVIYEQLIVAKSVYQQRILVKDYKHVPGLTHEPFTANNLTKKELLASTYGVNDSRYNLADYRTATFTDTAILTKIPGGSVLYRVTDKGGEAGGFWTLEPPKQLKSVIGGTAVMPEWNGFTRVYSYTVPAEGMYAWKGKAAAQQISTDPQFQSPEYELAGEGTQLFINDFLRDSAFKAAVVDVTAEYKKWK